jgi:ATP-dependent protease Clp ATPase subunit
MNDINFTSAKYVSYNGVNSSIIVVIDGITMSVPLDPANRHYQEIMSQVAAGDLTIADAD